MLSTHEKFESFNKKPIGDTKATIAGIYSLSLDSLEEVNNIVNNGLQAGGTEPNEMKDYGFMQLRSIEDLDGNTWEIFFMDITKIPAQ